MQAVDSGHAMSLEKEEKGKKHGKDAKLMLVVVS